MNKDTSRPTRAGEPTKNLWRLCPWTKLSPFLISSYRRRVSYGKHSANYRSSDASTDQSDDTVRGSDSKQDDLFTTVVNKKRNRTSLLRRQRQRADNSASMYIDTHPAAPTTLTDSPASPNTSFTP
ncbi:hypothetical protein EVAR_42740_1 [Eumeta japonica]|uniref:Uncharacterized protein n=1 Tax=Eumeta variegata TaxID=151549 RepID=A0A4C1XL26_EUMVA|nr:hypothetical protein EVAR_42740_1 [Eumeta japonica]